MGLVFVLLMLGVISMPLYCLCDPFRVWADSIILKRPIIWVEKSDGEVFWTNLIVSPTGRLTCRKSPTMNFDTYVLSADGTGNMGYYGKFQWGYKKPPKEAKKS